MPPFPILDFDPDRKAIINPPPAKPGEELPARVVPCFFQDVLRDLKAAGRLTQIYELRSELGPVPVYRLEGDHPAVTVYHAGLGAPLAAGLLEEIIGLGGRYFIACGGCGVLDGAHDVGHLFMVTDAVRDEGMSYHYLPPEAPAQASPRAIAALEATLKRHDLPIHPTKTWTTDAFYRETPARRDRRVAEGCEVVEMEAAAFFAVAAFRGVEFGQLLYGGDVVIPDGWDRRSWHTRGDIRLNLFELAAEAVLQI